MFHLKEVKYKDILNIENLIIPEYKVTCIVGESGSGKTTLLKLLNKIISYDSGEIYYKNKPLSQIDSIAHRRNVVMLPQSPAIFNGSIKDNLLIGLKFAEKPIVSDNKLTEILEFINLNKKLNENAQKLSGGEKQRLALGRILLLNPEVFLLDEPSSALDDETEEIIIKKLVEYTKSNNKTLIMVTHSKKVAKDFGDNIIEVKKGKIIN
ncbi:ABC transporter ATP-binding protein [Thermohalobacter berrensis]|uniref:ABC transporter ATP-binding protein n=1 Tax=Thermohalobacter berrensis TaxID=99594 RepID=A0A419SXW8_9FIRM|nr:ABC transporter ATP-binding protein [Thermohalobacter berrensis]RKD30035.1 ABC transporter ATP-binding protein [Thermohalobacter berrensis]